MSLLTSIRNKISTNATEVGFNNVQSNEPKEQTANTASSTERRRAAGKKAAKTNIEKYGKDFYSRIGQKGDKVSNGKPKCFAAQPTEKVSAAGRLGGSISRRGASKQTNKN